jgi:lysophospholipase L1-like esterase
MCGADATIQAAIEYPLGGTIYPLLFSGSSSGVVKDYSTLLSDLLTITIPSGATFAVREYRVCGAGGGTPYANTLAIDTIDGDCYQYGSSVANLVNNVGSFSSTGTVFYKPVAIFGTTTLPSYALLGDSRVEGYSDTSNGNLHIGEFERTVGLTRAFTNFGVGGDQIGSIMWGNGNAVVQFGQAFAQRAAIIRKFCTHILCNYGVNDMFSSSAASAGGLISYITAIRREFPAHYWYQSIPMGEATSTDNFITVGNQSLANPTAETQRRLYANALRAGALGTLVDGVFDTASVVESSPNSGLWKVPGGGGGYTIDGVHCLAAGYQLIQTSGVINVM